MPKKLWGMPIKTNSGRTDTKALVREMKLGTGDNVSSGSPRRYVQDATTSRVYPAEQLLRGWVSEHWPRELRWRVGDVSAVQVYVDQVIAFPWSLWRPFPCTVRMHQHPAPVYRSAIYLPSDARAWRELVVLHELGHHFARQNSGNDHGPVWQSAFRSLLADAMGLEVRAKFDEFLEGQG